MEAASAQSTYGGFDLELASLEATAAPPPVPAAAPAAEDDALPLEPMEGARVKRGPSWVAKVYGDQDGAASQGAPALGTVLFPADDAPAAVWWRVRWDHQAVPGQRPETFCYRWDPEVRLSEPSARPALSFAPLLSGRYLRPGHGHCR